MRSCPASEGWGAGRPSRVDVTAVRKSTLQLALDDGKHTRPAPILTVLRRSQHSTWTKALRVPYRFALLPSQAHARCAYHSHRTIITLLRPFFRSRSLQKLLSPWTSPDQRLPYIYVEDGQCCQAMFLAKLHMYTGAIHSARAQEQHCSIFSTYFIHSLGRALLIKRSRGTW